jgi:hypothetical protein
MMLNNYETTKLHKLLLCFGEIGRAVCNLDYSQEDYEENVVPWIKGLQEALS